MKSTGEVMGISDDLGIAFAKSQLGANLKFPLKGRVFFSVKNKDKRQGVLGGQGTGAGRLRSRRHRGHGPRPCAAAGIKVSRRSTRSTRPRPNILDEIHSGKVDLIINTPAGKGAMSDDFQIRRAALQHGITCVTTLSAASETVNAITSMKAIGPSRSRPCRRITMLRLPLRGPPRANVRL